MTKAKLLNLCLPVGARGTITKIHDQGRQLRIKWDDGEERMVKTGDVRKESAQEDDSHARSTNAKEFRQDLASLERRMDAKLLAMESRLKAAAGGGGSTPNSFPQQKR